VPLCLGGEKGLRQAHIEQCQPILKRLQSEPAKDKSDPEGSEASLGKAVSVILYEGVHRHSNAGDKAGDEPYADRKIPGVLKTMHQRTTNQCRGDVADRPNDRSPKLTTGKAWTARGCIISSGAHAARIGEDLADRDESGKGDCVLQA